MAANTNSLFDLQKIAIQEVISKKVEVSMAKADPVWRDTVLSAQGVGEVGAIGRGLEVKKLYNSAVGGIIESGSVRGDFTMYGDDSGVNYSNVLQTIGTTRTVPSAADDPTGLPASLRVPMKSIQTNMKITMEEKQAEALPAFIGQVMAPRLLNFAEGLARRLCNSWYVSQTNNYRLAAIGSSSGSEAYTVDGTNKKIKFYPTNRALNRFARGDRVDIMRNFSGTPVRMNDSNVTAGGVVQADAATQTLASRIRAFVSAVNKLQGWVEVTFDPATSAGKFSGTGSLSTGQLSTDSYIVWANTTVGGLAMTDIPGFHSWAKFGGAATADNQLLGSEALGTTVDGIIDIRIHPQFQSFYKNVNGVLTEHRLNTYLDRVQEAFEDDGHYIDTMVTTAGVIRAAAAQKEARMILDRTGNLSSLAKEGEDGMGMVHHHNGRQYSMTVSRWVEYGTLLGYRRSGNWVKYVPPKVPGSGNMPGVEPGIPFELLVPSITGQPAVTWPIYNNGELTSASQMPGHLRMTLVPDKQVRMMKLDNLTEERVNTDTM